MIIPKTEICRREGRRMEKDKFIAAAVDFFKKSRLSKEPQLLVSLKGGYRMLRLYAELAVERRGLLRGSLNRA